MKDPLEGALKAATEPSVVADIPAYQDKDEVGSFCWIGEFELVGGVVLGSDIGV